MSKLSVVIVLVVVLWQIIGAIAQSAAKGQQKAKAAERRRRELAAGSARGGRGPVSPPGAPPGTLPVSPPGRRAEDLAARRKAQLEELRRRGAGRPTAPIRTTQARIGAARAVPRPGSSPPAVPISTLRADHRAVRQAKEAERRLRAEQLPRQIAAQDAAARREERLERKREAERARKRARQQVESDEAWSRGPKPALAGRRARIGRLLRRRQGLGDLFLLKEILDLPLALRKGQAAAPIERDRG